MPLCVQWFVLKKQPKRKREATAECGHDPNWYKWENSSKRHSFSLHNSTSFTSFSTVQEKRGLLMLLRLLGLAAWCLVLAKVNKLVVDNVHVIGLHYLDEPWLQATIILNMFDWIGKSRWEKDWRQVGRSFFTTLHQLMRACPNLNKTLIVLRHWKCVCIAHSLKISVKEETCWDNLYLACKLWKWKFFAYDGRFNKAKGVDASHVLHQQMELT